MKTVILIIGIVVFIIGIIFAFPSNRLKNVKAKKAIALILAFLGLLTALCGSEIITFNIHNGDNIIQKIKGNTVVLADSRNEKVEVYYDGNEKHLKMLGKAEAYYINEEFEKAFEIYSNEELKEDSIAKLNLGYMYAMGLGTEVDLKKALRLFDDSKMIEGKRNAAAMLIAVNAEGKK